MARYVNITMIIYKASWLGNISSTNVEHRALSVMHEIGGAWNSE